VNPTVEAQAGFFTTEWAVVKNAAHRDETLRLKALGRLVRHYQPALGEYLRRRFRLAPERCQDLLQTFFLEKLLKKGLLARADRERGRFRTFLLQSINSHVLDEFRKGRTKKRKPDGGWQSLESLIENGTEIEEEITHEEFESAFVKQVIAESIQGTHTHCMEHQIREAWEILHARILGPLLEGTEQVPYTQLVEELGLENTTEAQNRLATAKRIFQRQFRSVLKETTANDQDLIEEINVLKKFLKDSGKNLEESS
jgi:RNA polymerase sigma-70 factor (ECF subfamily)